FPTIFTNGINYPHLVLFAAFMALMPFWARIPGRAAGGAFFGESKRGLAVGGAFAAIFTAALLWIFQNPDVRELVAYDRLYKSRQWEAILEKAARHPSS